MDPSQNPYSNPNYNIPNLPQNSNTGRPIYNFPNQPQNMGVHPNLQMQYVMPQNFDMQFPYQHPYMPFGYQPPPGNTYVPPHMDRPITDEPNTPRVSSGSTDIPLTQHSANRSGYASWTTEDNKILLNGYYHFSNDSELGANQKGDTFWGKIARFVNENTQGGVERTSNKCQTHFRDINRKISSFVGCYSTATREMHSGWSDDDYVSSALQLYHEQRGTRFNLLEEWKLVRNQPKYMTGVTESGSSGSKRKSGDVESVDPPAARPEGRDAAKKKARASSSKSSTARKTKLSIEDEFSNLASARENLEKSRASTVAAMLEYAAGQKEVAHAKKLEMWMTLKNKERDDEDEEIYQMLKKELLGR